MVVVSSAGMESRSSRQHPISIIPWSLETSKELKLVHSQRDCPVFSVVSAYTEIGNVAPYACLFNNLLSFLSSIEPFI